MLSSPSELVVTDEWITAVAEMERKFCQEIRKVDPRQAVLDLIEISKLTVEYIKPYLGAGRPKVLEVGSGWGFGLTRLRKAGIDAIGIEPGDSVGFEGRSQKALELLESNGVRPAKNYLRTASGENLPFPDNTFDIVFSMQVLEHVKDVKQCVRESFRVVKPGGLVLMDLPNYDSFYEGHYHIVWLPYVLRSKSVAKWYVRTFFKRPDYFVDELNFIRPDLMQKILDGIPECGTRKTTMYGLHPVMGRPFYRLWNPAAGIREKLLGKPDLTLGERMELQLSGAVLKSLESLGIFSGIRIECSKKAPSA